MGVMKSGAEKGREKGESIRITLFHGPVINKVFLDLEDEMY